MDCQISPIFKEAKVLPQKADASKILGEQTIFFYHLTAVIVFASGASSNTNASRAKSAENHKLLLSVDSRTCSIEKNLQRNKLSHKI